MGHRKIICSTYETKPKEKNRKEKQKRKEKNRKEKQKRRVEGTF